MDVTRKEHDVHIMMTLSNKSDPRHIIHLDLLPGVVLNEWGGRDSDRVIAVRTLVSFPPPREVTESGDNVWHYRESAAETRF